MEGTKGVGSPRAGEPKREILELQLLEKTLKACEGPGVGASIEGPQGLGDRKQRPLNSRPEGGAGGTP